MVQLRDLISKIIPKEPSSKIPELDGIRALAVMMVAVYHY